jgi:protein gp37
MSKIEWTEKTWNPIVGCSKVSAGCKNCYAIRMAWRIVHNPKAQKKYAGTVEKTAGGQINWTGKVNIPSLNDLHFNDPFELLAPLKWRKPQMVFVNSMSDLFHDGVPFDVIDAIFAIMVLTPQHTYQVLTKRPARMLEYFSVGKETLVKRWEDATYNMSLCDRNEDMDGPACAVYNRCEREWPLSNIWLGVSVENQETANERIPLLLQVPAGVRFLSCEPLLGPVRVDHIDADGAGHKEYCQINALTGRHTDMARPCADVNKIDWVIVGGESGHGARPVHPDWVRSLRDQCKRNGTAFFFKQWGDYHTKSILTGTGEPIFRMFASKQHWIDKAQTWVRGGRCISIDGRECKIGKDFKECLYPVAIMDKVGKSNAGRQLDGREWNEFPGNKTEPVEDPDLATGGFDY